ncbi:MAG: hypothetical protein ABIH42_04040 [Planctomycetota bacterium]
MQKHDTIIVFLFFLIVFGCFAFAQDESKEIQSKRHSQFTIDEEKLKYNTQSAMGYGAILISAILSVFGPTLIVWILCRIKYDGVDFMKILFISIGMFIVSIALFYSMPNFGLALLQPQTLYKNTDLFVRSLAFIIASYASVKIFLQLRTIRSVITSLFYVASFYFAARISYYLVSNTGAARFFQ